MNAEEQYLVDAIRVLQRDYEKAAKPYFDRLVQIRSMQPPPPMIISLEQAEAIGLQIPALGE
jgi:hypothetical protein